MDLVFLDLFLDLDLDLRDLILPESLGKVGPKKVPDSDKFGFLRQPDFVTTQLGSEAHTFFFLPTHFPNSLDCLLYLYLLDLLVFLDIRDFFMDLVFLDLFLDLDLDLRDLILPESLGKVGPKKVPDSDKFGFLRQPDFVTTQLGSEAHTFFFLPTHFPNSLGCLLYLYLLDLP